MTDRLTQLQDALDNMLTQMYATLHYISTHHAHGSIASQPSQSSAPLTRATSTLTDTQGVHSQSAARAAAAGGADDAALNGDGDGPLDAAAAERPPRSVEEEIMQGVRNPVADAPGVFDARMQELAQDLVVKEQQIEAIVDSLPGIGVSEGGQVRKIAELEKELERVEAERREAGLLRDELKGRVESVLAGVRRI